MSGDSTPNPLSLAWVRCSLMFYTLWFCDWSNDSNTSLFVYVLPYWVKRGTGCCRVALPVRTLWLCHPPRLPRCFVASFTKAMLLCNSPYSSPRVGWGLKSWVEEVCVLWDNNVRKEFPIFLRRTVVNCLIPPVTSPPSVPHLWLGILRNLRCATSPSLDTVRLIPIGCRLSISRDVPSPVCPRDRISALGWGWVVNPVQISASFAPPP